MCRVVSYPVIRPCVLPYAEVLRLALPLGHVPCFGLCALPFPALKPFTIFLPVLPSGSVLRLILSCPGCHSLRLASFGLVPFELVQLV